MASVAILVNGLAASGKTTLATALGALLDCPVLTKDLLKERYAEIVAPEPTAVCSGRSRWRRSGGSPPRPTGSTTRGRPP